MSIHRHRVLLRDGTARSLPVDFSAVAARLEALSSDSNLTMERRSTSEDDLPDTPWTLLPDSDEDQERENYENIVRDGAVPAYAIQLLEDVVKDPDTALKSP